jgi:hypothetical protein
MGDLGLVLDLFCAVGVPQRAQRLLLNDLCKSLDPA